jgi:nucleoside-diphosphate-sugar epimerase
MVVGNGMVAKKFIHYSESEDVIIFASGVSNSKLAIKTEFDREKKLLCDILDNYYGRKLIYFSTFNLYDPVEKKSPYCIHKFDMEEFITINVPNYHIFRLGHVAGASAKEYTILSFLYNSIKNGTFFNLWKYASRNIIDIDDVSKICTHIIDNNLYINEVTNICNSHNISIIELVTTLEKVLSMKANYNLVEAGESPDFDNTKIRLISKELGISFDQFYVKDVITKYYTKYSKE